MIVEQTASEGFPSSEPPSPKTSRKEKQVKRKSHPLPLKYTILI